MKLELKVIAKIRTDFPTKFGIPRQSGLVNTFSKIVFEPMFRDDSALRGLEEFSHLWLIWGFSENQADTWSPTVRPPRLGGNKKVGVFASRSPFRPNHIGLSSVKLLGIEQDKNDGATLIVSGADLLDGTPVYDVKPYLPFTDCHPDAVGGYAESQKDYKLSVNFPDDLLSLIPENKRAALIECLSDDPRPSYQDDGKEYGMNFASFNIRFTVKDLFLTVLSVEKA